MHLSPFSRKVRRGPRGWRVLLQTALCPPRSNFFLTLQATERFAMLFIGLLCFLRMWQMMFLRWPNFVLGLLSL